MNDKYISIITNFGCHYTCPYCIVKNNNLDIPRTTINGLDSLWLEIVRNQCNWVSLFGGGDPLWHYSEHKDWYDKFFEITEDLNIELHTSLPNVAGAPYDAFDRVVYHLHSLEQLYSIKRQNLKAGHKKLWWYIEQNDYNLYYCQNKVYTEYKNIGR